MRFSVEALCLLVCTLLCVCSAGKWWRDKDKGKTNTTSGSDIENLADQLDAKHLIVVMSEGRSGSGLICELVGNVLGTELGGELLGRTASAMKLNKDPHGQILLQWLGDRGVKIVYNFRNPLDVLISSDKHHEDVRLTLNTHSLLKRLDNLYHLREMDLARAAQFHVPFLSMGYSDFAEGSKANQLKALQRIGDFLGVDRQLTLKDLRVPTVSTAPVSQEDQLRNYAEVVKTLNGTKDQGLLHYSNTFYFSRNLPLPQMLLAHTREQQQQ
ncbi:hypothetical protein B484DRAFT_455682 [Ochromonadaceae sp. CCMP2298]|nr:hypothetical protein B484DRAFT_455682 [Ochromonadaceae sp. CCMP2298]